MDLGFIPKMNEWSGMEIGINDSWSGCASLLPVCKHSDSKVWRLSSNDAFSHIKPNHHWAEMYINLHFILLIFWKVVEQFVLHLDGDQTVENPKVNWFKQLKVFSLCVIYKVSFWASADKRNVRYVNSWIFQGSLLGAAAKFWSFGIQDTGLPWISTFYQQKIMFSDTVWKCRGKLK